MNLAFQSRYVGLPAWFQAKTALAESERIQPGQLNVTLGCQEKIQELEFLTTIFAKSAPTHNISKDREHLVKQERRAFEIRSRFDT